MKNPVGRVGETLHPDEFKSAFPKMAAMAIDAARRQNDIVATITRKETDGPLALSPAEIADTKSRFEQALQLAPAKPAQSNTFQKPIIGSKDELLINYDETGQPQNFTRITPGNPGSGLVTLTKFYTSETGEHTVKTGIYTKEMQGAGYGTPVFVETENSKVNPDSNPRPMQPADAAHLLFDVEHLAYRPQYR